MEFADKISLILTSHCFEILIDNIISHFNNRYKNEAQRSTGQLYGFGKFDTALPSIKKELEALSGTFVNGKYLYDKKREFQSGKPFIKLSRPYNFILFQYLGYKNIREFASKITLEEELKKQLDLIGSPKNDEDYYYISYHYGEYKEVVKAQVIVKDNWKSVEYKYLYPEPDGGYKEFLYYGNIKRRADALHIRTKTLLDGKMVESGENILYIGYGDPGRSQFMLGVFSAFDINNRLIAAKTIHEKCSSKEEMIKLSRDKKVPAYIVQEIRNKRVENDIRIPHDKLEISAKSPYSSTYAKISGHYKFSFFHEGKELGDLGIFIDPNTYKMTSPNSGILINEDNIDLIQNGSVLHYSLHLTGIAPFVRLEIFVKTYYLNNDADIVKGVYSGIDIENRLTNGEVLIDFDPK